MYVVSESAEQIDDHAAQIAATYLVHVRKTVASKMRKNGIWHNLSVEFEMKAALWNQVSVELVSNVINYLKLMM